MNNVETTMEFLFQRRTPNLPVQALAEIFDRLIWCMDDQGAELLEVRRKWLEGSDKEKIAIALAMNEVFPCNTRDEMHQLFSTISNRWPEFQDRCQEILQQWDQQVKS